MAKRIKPAKLAPRGAQMPTGKGWRLVTPSGNRWFKAALLKTFRSQGSRFLIYRVN